MAGRRKRRLKKSVKRFIFANMGIILGVALAFSVNAEAPTTSVIVEEGAVSVEDYQFFKFTSVLSASLPKSLQQIGFSAFEGCEKLKQIELPDELRVIDNRAFAKCSSLKEVTIPENAVFIGNAAFYGCSSLEKITLPTTLKEISNNLFYGCESLKDIKIPEGVTRIGQQSFYDCVNLTNIELPDGLTNIDDGAFYDCEGLTSLYIPASVIYIGVDAFTGCNNLVLKYEPGSYAENYAKANKLDKERTKMVEVVSKEKSVANPDVPATGVDTPYMAVSLMVLCAMAWLVWERRKSKEVY